MNILSLFDGMGCGAIAFVKNEIKIQNYFAFEIDKFAIEQAKHIAKIYNVPYVFCGDVFDANFANYENIDFLIGGSPCTYWSIAQNPNTREKTATGKGWLLFEKYVQALNYLKPKYFIYENNFSMANDIKKAITTALGVEPVLIDSALFSAQMRKRLYWFGVRQLNKKYKTPEILLPKLYHSCTKVFNLPCKNGIQLKNRQYRVYDIFGKSPCMCANGGGLGANTGLYAIDINLNNIIEKGVPLVQHEKAYCLCASYGNSPPTPKDTLTKHRRDMVAEIIDFNQFQKTKKYKIYRVQNKLININNIKYKCNLRDGYYYIRKLSVREAARLQTVPEEVNFIVSDTQAYKMLGNGWTINVIRYIINNLLEKGVPNE